MQIHIFCFGRLRDLVAPRLDLELPEGATVSALVATLLERYPSLAPYSRSLAVAVNHSFAPGDTPLKAADEVALMPPVSGGSGAAELPLVSPHARLQREPIDSTPLLSSIKQPEDGAMVVFDGVVRNNTRGRQTLYLEYDSYPEMALAQMEQLALDALAKFAVRDVRIVHRVGRQEIGDTTVLIAVASGHRAAAFDACRYAIDTLKKKVPIWKKEFFADGAEWAAGDPFPEELKP